jgi:hypothetical protein
MTKRSFIRNFSSSSSSNIPNPKKAKEIWLQSVYDDYHTNHHDAPNDTTTTTMHHQPQSTSSSVSSSSLQYQPSLHWREWYIPQEYENPWDMIYVTHSELSQSRFRVPSTAYSNANNSSDTIPSLENIAKNLDYMSKHCIFLIQNYHNFALTAQNSITTEYGNVLLHKLLQLLPTHSTSSSSVTTATTNTEKSTMIAYRAFMILQNMELTDGTQIRIPHGTNQILPPSGSRATTTSTSSPIIRRRRRRQNQNQNDTLHHTDHDTRHDHDDSMHTHHHHHDNNRTIAAAHHHPRTHRLPRTIPKPNRDTYNTILLLLSRTSGSYTIPQMAQAIVEQMEYRYNVLQELDVKVTNYHYNCILLAWSLCTEYDKCLYATQLLIYNATRSHSHEIVDASSYIHVLRICANHVKLSQNIPPSSSSSTDDANKHDTVTSSSLSSQQLQLLGANVAIQLWREMFERNTSKTTTTSYNSTGVVGGGGGGKSTLNSRHDTTLQTLLTQYLSDEERHSPMYIPDFPPHFYSHFLQAIRPLPVVYPSQYSYNNNDNYDPRTMIKLNNSSNNNNNYSIREIYYMKCMDHAIEHGKVNTYVLQEFFVHVKNKYIFEMFLGEYRSKIHGMHPNDAVQHLISACVPKSWSRNIQTSTHNYSTTQNNNS